MRTVKMFITPTGATAGPVPTGDPVKENAATSGTLPGITPAGGEKMASPPLGPAPVIGIMGEVFDEGSCRVYYSRGRTAVMNAPGPVCFIIPVVRATTTVADPPVDKQGKK